MSNALHRRYPDSLLCSGALTAHRSFRLVLLRSRPDTVHEFPLRKTRASTPLFRGGPTKKHPRQDITPAVADCRYRAPLSPRLRGNFLTISGRKNLLHHYNGIFLSRQPKKIKRRGTHSTHFIQCVGKVSVWPIKSFSLYRNVETAVPNMLTLDIYRDMIQS